MRHPAHVDRRDRGRAHEQLRRVAIGGVFTLAMARAAGLTRAAVRHRIARGRWRHVVGQAYVDLSVAPPTRQTDLQRRAIGASLSWPGSIVCLRTAAMLYGLPVAEDGETHVVVSDRRRPTAGLTPHRMRLAPGEVSARPSFRLTSRPRTVVDCLMQLPRREAESLMAWVLTRDVVGHDELARATESRAGHRGVAQLRALVADTADGAIGALERRLHELLDEARITGWSANEPIVVDGVIVARADVLFRAERVIVEVDGRAYHTDFEADRARLNTLALAGYTVLRFTWTQLTTRPQEVVRQIREALAAAR